MCCVSTAKVKNVVGKVDYKYEEIEIAMSIYMDDISVAGRPERQKKDMCKNGIGKENETQFKKNEVYGGRNKK